jgi:redox-sensitive bicupin YhaK (pirin superfamily)
MRYMARTTLTSSETGLIGPESLVLFDDGDQLMLTTADEAVRFLLVSGKPIREPVAWYGPIVMNSREELQTAFEEYRNGTFIKHTRHDAFQV